jgi:transcriptional regulator with XRE-family HTH domain
MIYFTSYHFGQMIEQGYGLPKVDSTIWLYKLFLSWSKLFLKTLKSIEMYGTKIRLIRLSRGLNQEGVAKELGIKQNAYSKIETNQSKISDEKLATIFGVSAEDIKSPEPIIINFHNSPQSNGAVINHGEIKNQNEQLLEQLSQQLAIKDKQIEQLIHQTQQLTEQNKLLIGSLNK